MTNSQADAHESWLVRWSPHTLGFSWSNPHDMNYGGVVHSAPMGAPWSSCPYPSYLHRQLCLPSEPILKKFPQQHYQELPLNHNSPPTRTCSIVPFLSRLWCSSLNRIRGSTGLLVKNFFFWFSPQIKVYCDSNSPSPSSTSPLPWKQGQERHEPFCQ